jgi:homoserine kinase
MKKILTVSIPATSANLGPGFDCMGIALDLWNTFELHTTAPDQPTRVENIGEGAARRPTDDSHMVAATMIDEARKSGINARRGYAIVCRNAVPTGSGMGSSSTAVLAGLIFANAVRPKSPLPEHVEGAASDGILARACAIEGHGDNVAPAMLGGLVLVASHNTKFVTRRARLQLSHLAGAGGPAHHLLSRRCRV